MLYAHLLLTNTIFDKYCDYACKYWVLRGRGISVASYITTDRLVCDCPQTWAIKTQKAVVA